MLSGRIAPQRCFPKRPFRTRLEPSCLAASQQELVEAHECLLGHFGIVRLVSFRIDQSCFSNQYFVASQPALGPSYGTLKKGAAATRNTDGGPNIATRLRGRSEVATAELSALMNVPRLACGFCG